MVPQIYYYYVHFVYHLDHIEFLVMAYGISYLHIYYLNHRGTYVGELFLE